MTHQLFRSPRPTLGVAVLGAGPLAEEVVRILRATGGDLRERAGAELTLDGEPELVVDATEDAGTVTAVLDALRHGRSVITANTALIAEHGPRLAAAAEQHGADLCFEAAVAGGVPVVRPLTQSLAGDRVHQVLGVFPGEPGRGIAEQAAILATLAFHTRVEVGEVYVENPGPAPSYDLAVAAALGLSLRTLVVCSRVVEHPGAGGKEQISVRVHPALLPAADPLAGVAAPFGAVAVDAAAAGRLMFYGATTPAATASALLGDLITAARNRVHGGRAPRASYYAELPLAPLGDTPTRYYLNLSVTDHAGALARVATVFAAHGVSIARVRQEHDGPDARLIILTHRAPDSAFADTADALAETPCVRAVLTRWRIEGTDDQ